MSNGQKKHYRSMFISDIHLGTYDCQSDKLNDALKYFDVEKLYLVGDIVDFWALGRRSYFPRSHIEIVRKILKHKNVVWVTGNHDEIIRELTPICYDNIMIVDNIIHKTSNGTRLFVVHGDIFDCVIRNARWVAWCGDIGYTVLLRCNTYLTKIRRLFRLNRHWSLSQRIKYRVKSAVNFIGNYQQAIIKAAHHHDVDGVICGHIHHGEVTTFDGIIYGNCGDWVESCSMIVECDDGQLQLLKWDDIVNEENQKRLSKSKGKRTT